METEHLLRFLFAIELIINWLYNIIDIRNIDEKEELIMYILDNILFDFLLKIIAVAKKKRNDKRVPLIIRLGSWLVCIVDAVVRYILIPVMFGVFSYILFAHKQYAFFAVMLFAFIFSCTPYYRLIKKFIKKRKESSVDINNDPFDMDNKINHVE
ncbi:hypothetical protein [Breznakia pachnodae]|uniref:Uncharacterized protein n=1 Tax=Breznakia pachnodae TaxID=265178 RepID=A0ABU0E2N3_9FIRM|nr:hypothetical protein [Breznakia pachnodae]MDQ0361157.1 hypothetical protein [Breznakia pachnodae]